MAEDAMVEHDALDAIPQIALRIPGPWASQKEFTDAVDRAKTGYALDEGGLAHPKSGRRFLLGASDPDDEIAALFAHSGRLSKQEVKKIASHQVKVHLTAPGGSIEAAKAAMAAAAALVKAGGYGVFVDNSGNAHGRDDWLALAGDKQLGGVYWAYVAVTAASAGEGDAWSVGMHCLGYRDAEVFGIPDREAAGYLLHNFLGYSYQSGNMIIDGDPLGSEQGALFRARARPFTRVPRGSPLYNPYGVWRLEPIETDAGESEN
jgi:hypothetical protein